MKWFKQAFFLFILCCSMYRVSASIQATIPDNLIECYRNKTLFFRENLLPNTVSSFLTIIRKIESSSMINMDIRTLASTLLTSYRLDGIERNPQVTASDYIIPYSPSGAEFYRYKILMDRLIPNSGLTIPNNTLTSIEKCSLHFMLSTSVDPWERGDESSVCNSLSNKQPALKWDSRFIRSANLNNDLDTEVESFNPILINSEKNTNASNQVGNFQSGVPRTLMDTYTDVALSSCPIENGVIFSKYGAVKIGIVLAGIAAGLQSQSVSQINLFKLATRSKTFRKKPMTSVTTGNSNVSNKWVATLSGEIAELALLQGPVSLQNMRVGLSGGWNDTLVPRYYFLSGQDRGALTDTDIRSGIDGLLIATKVLGWENLVSNLKISQVIDMYYSERGVFDKSIRACQRQDQFNTIAPADTMLQESVAFSEVLQLELPIAVNIASEALQELNGIAVSKLSTYVANMDKVDCITSSTSTVLTAKPAVSLYIVIDFNYDFSTAQRIINYIVDKMEVSIFSCNVSVINAKDGSTLVFSTNSALEFYKNFNRINYERANRGFDLPKIMQELGYNLTKKLDYDKVLLTAGGPSSVVLILPYSTSTIPDSDKDYISKKLVYYSQVIPDVKFMYLTSGAKDTYSTFVKDPSNDIFILTTDIATSINPFITRLTQVHRRIINPLCTSSFSGSYSSNIVLTDYVEPLGINYYRVHPNYFYKSGSARIKIQGSNSAVLSVCMSRSNLLPNSSSSKSDSTCSQITSNSYDITINDQSCSGSSFGYQCQPIYFSVAATQTTTTSNNFQCSDDGCRYPDSVKFTIIQDGLTCYSNANLLNVSFLLMFSLSLLSLIF